MCLTFNEDLRFFERWDLLDLWVLCCFFHKVIKYASDLRRENHFQQAESIKSDVLIELFSKCRGFQRESWISTGIGESFNWRKKCFRWKTWRFDFTVRDLSKFSLRKFGLNWNKRDPWLKKEVFSAEKAVFRLNYSRILDFFSETNEFFTGESRLISIPLIRTPVVFTRVNNCSLSFYFYDLEIKYNASALRLLHVKIIEIINFIIFTGNTQYQRILNLRKWIIIDVLLIKLK